MGLLREIQAAALDGKEPMAGVLRRCMVLAARLDHDPLRKWVELELNGYPPGTDLPPYRSIPTQSYGNFVGPFGAQLTKAPIPPMTVPEPLRDVVQRADLRQGVAAYDDLLSASSNAPHDFTAPWPADMIAHVGQGIYVEMTCLTAWRNLPRGAVVALLDTVRNRVLSFALAIEKEAPDAGEAAPGHVRIPLPRVDDIFKVIVIGGPRADPGSLGSG